MKFFYYIYFKIFYFLLLKKIDIDKIKKLKKKFFFLRNVPNEKHNFLDRSYFKKKKILYKDISVLKYSNYNVQVLRFLKIYIELKNKIKFKSNLDLGCGVGYFQFICNYFSNRYLGIDYLVGNKYYNSESIKYLKAYQKILNINCKNFKITKNFKIKSSQKFDLITAFSANFDGHYKNHRYNFVPWKFNEYEIFFKSIKKYLNKDGKFLFKFNHKWEYKKKFYINYKYKKYLIKNNLWHGEGIVANFKPTKELKKFL